MARVALADLDTMDRYPEYAAACLKIRARRQGKAPLVLNVGQRKFQAAIESCLRRDMPPRVIILKARQLGFTTDGIGRQFHLTHLRRDRTASLMAHTKESAESIFKIARYYYDNLPESARPAASYFTKNSIVFDHNGSSMQVVVAAERGGRGMTIHYAHLSEYARYADPEGVLDGVMNAVPDQMDSLVVIESTAFGMNAFHDLWVGAKSGANDFVPVFSPWFDEPSYVRPAAFAERDLDDEERDLMGRFRLSLDQLAWRRWAIRNKCKGDVQRFRQENPSTDTEAFLVTGSPVFTADALQWHNQHVPPGTAECPIEVSDLPPARDIGWSEENQEPYLTEPFAGGPLRIYRPPVKRHLYIAGVDPSEGDPGSDPSPIVVMDRMTLEIAAVWHGRRRPDRLAHAARALATYFNKAHTIWEANNHGLPFGLEFEKIYDDFYMRRTSIGSVKRKVSDAPGFNTNVATKGLLWALVRRYFDDKLVPVRSPEVVAELASVYFESVGGQRVVKNYDGKTKDLLVCVGLDLVAHMDDPDAAIAPLSEEEYDELQSLRREQYVARSMGIDDDGPLRLVMDRTSATARDLEEIDERIQYERGRDRRIGLEDGV
jgi:hypothetical protein